MEDILTKKQIYSFQKSRDFTSVERGLKRLQEENVRFIHWESDDYPDRFRNLFDPPYGFYLRGHLPPPHHLSVAIVGSRRPTPYGRSMAREFSSELASHGVTIVSGMASGIDAEAHKAALNCSGDTLGILGGGIDTMYPKTNSNLYLDMYDSGGILSEYNIGIINRSGLFPMRNRLISGIADAVLVVEAGMKSGSLITADQGMEQGKEIYAVPGRIVDPLSIGCNRLISQGAVIAESPLGILRDLQEIYKNRKLSYIGCADMKDDEEFTGQMDTGDLCSDGTCHSIEDGILAECIFSKNEERILQYIDISTPISFDALLSKTGLYWQELQHNLVEMEMKSWIYQPQQNMYLKKIF